MPSSLACATSPSLAHLQSSLCRRYLGALEAEICVALLESATASGALWKTAPESMNDPHGEQYHKQRDFPGMLSIWNRAWSGSIQQND